MNCIHLIEQIPGGVRCRKNGGPETTCSHGVCLHCDDGGGKNAQWKLSGSNSPLPGHHLPDDNDEAEQLIEHERRRLKRGGCCGQPTE